MKGTSRLLILSTLVFLAACSETPDSPVQSKGSSPSELDFAFISVSGDRIQTLHDLKYAVSMAEGFRVTEPKNRIDHFGDTPYKISLAAFTNPASALMIHAEEVADSSGASDYSHLPVATWPNEEFRSGGPLCIDVPAEEVDGEHDLLFLRQNGFEPSGSMVFAQYFATTADMNSEIVISLLHRVASCDDSPAHADVIAELQAQVLVSRVD